MKRLPGKLSHSEILNFDNVTSSWEKLKTKIKQAAQETVGLRKNTNEQRQYMKKRKPWYSEEIIELVWTKR